MKYKLYWFTNSLENRTLIFIYSSPTSLNKRCDNITHQYLSNLTNPTTLKIVRFDCPPISPIYITHPKSSHVIIGKMSCISFDKVNHENTTSIITNAIFIYNDWNFCAPVYALTKIISCILLPLFQSVCLTFLCSLFKENRDQCFNQSRTKANFSHGHQQMGNVTNAERKFMSNATVISMIQQIRNKIFTLNELIEWSFMLRYKQGSRQIYFSFITSKLPKQGY